MNGQRGSTAASCSADPRSLRRAVVVDGGACSGAWPAAVVDVAGVFEVVVGGAPGGEELEAFL